MSVDSQLVQLNLVLLENQNISKLNERIDSENKAYKVKVEELTFKIKENEKEITMLKSNQKQSLHHFRSRRNTMQEEVDDLQAKLVELEAINDKRSLEKSTMMFMSEPHYISDQLFESNSNFDSGIVSHEDNPQTNKIAVSMLAGFRGNKMPEIIMSEEGSELDEPEVTQEQIQSLQNQIATLQEQLQTSQNDKARLQDQVDSFRNQTNCLENSFDGEVENLEVIRLKKECQFWKDRMIRFCSKSSEDVNDLSEKLKRSLVEIRSLKYKLSLLN